VAIGGGSLTVPYLAWCNVPVRNAIGTSAALGLPIAFFGTLGYIWNGWGEAGLPAWSVGYVYLPALLWVMAGSVVAAPVGARLAHRLPVATLKRILPVCWCCWQPRCCMASCRWRLADLDALERACGPFFVFAPRHTGGYGNLRNCYIIA